MKRDEFKAFYEIAKSKGIKEIEHAGYYWINLTQTQINKMCDLAIEQGYNYKDGWIYLNNGIGIRHRK